MRPHSFCTARMLCSRLRGRPAFRAGIGLSQISAATPAAMAGGFDSPNELADAGPAKEASQEGRPENPARMAAFGFGVV